MIPLLATYLARECRTDPRGMDPFNHYLPGSVGLWLYPNAASIDTDPDAPGFARVLIRLHSGPDLTSARAAYDSIRGRTVCAWHADGPALTPDVTVPADTTAIVFVPAARRRPGRGVGRLRDLPLPHPGGTMIERTRR